MRHMYRLFIAGLLLAALLAEAQPARAQGVPGGSRCFPETGKCVKGTFLAFWQRNGGLAVFGLPLSDELSEGGRTVQYFERQRFELHPENQPPYNVLLGRLGDDLLRRQGIDWATLPKATNPASPPCRFFPETGHNVCNLAGGPSFLAAWQRYGLEFDGQRGKSYAENLALFGLPLSEPMEVTIEGKKILAQWFERARFEYHPENPANSRVLFGRLGAEVMSASAPDGDVMLTQGDNGRTVNLAVGQTLVITLPSNPSTGYSWEVTGSVSTALRQDGEPQYTPGANMPGAPGTQTFRFVAMGPGSAPLTLVYRRPFEPNAPPAETFSVDVMVR